MLWSEDSGNITSFSEAESSSFESKSSPSAHKLLSVVGPVIAGMSAAAGRSSSPFIYRGSNGGQERGDESGHGHMSTLTAHGLAPLILLSIVLLRAQGQQERQQEAAGRATKSDSSPI